MKSRPEKTGLKGNIQEKTGNIAVVMLTMNQREKTLRCLESFKSVQTPHRLVLWDNGSADGTEEAVREAHPEVSFHRSPSNFGAAGGRNAAAEQAIRSVNPTYLLFIDNDTVVTPSFLASLLEPFGNDPTVGQTSAKIRYFKDPNRLNAAGGARINFSLGITTVTGCGEIDRGQYDEPVECIANGGCTLVRRDIFEIIEGFDTRFDPYGFEDLDFSLRVGKAGFRCLYAPSSLVYHDPSRTLVGDRYTAMYAFRKAKTWMIILFKHASPLEKACFFLVGIPYATLRVIFRVGKTMSLDIFRGLWRKTANHPKSAGRRI